MTAAFWGIGQFRFHAVVSFAHYLKEVKKAERKLALTGEENISSQCLPVISCFHSFSLY